MNVVTDDTFQQVVFQSQTPVLVDFYADWCAPCRAASPVIEQIAEDYAGRVAVVKSDVDKGSKYALEFGVRGIPNFVIFNGGQKVGQFVGWAAEQETQIRAALDALLGI
jgi:thioredoxin 1